MTNHDLRRRALAGWLALCLLSLVAACGRLDDALSPGRPEAYQQVPAHVGLAARLPAFSRGAAATPSLRVHAFYERVDATRVTLATLSVVLTDAATQALPLSIDLGACLTDPQRRGAELGSGHAAVCLVGLELTLLDGDRVLDQQMVGPLQLLPGVTSTVAEPVSLFEVGDMQVGGIGGASGAGGASRLELGRTLPLSATVVSTSGQVVSGRPVDWTSSAPTIARVDASTGVVTGIAVGRATITATFGTRSSGVDVLVVPPPSPITVVALGTTGGAGVVRSSPAGIDCQVASGQMSGTCTASFLGDAQVTLVATPGAGTVFSGWGGACLGVAATTTCVLPADQARTAVAGFQPLRRLSVSGSGTDDAVASAGRVTGAPGGIDCQVGGASPGGTCATSLVDGTVVTLTAAPAGQHVFLGWSGDCTGTAPVCTIALTEGDHTASARFGAPTRVSVGLTGTGGGGVTYSAAAGAGMLCSVAGAGATNGATPSGPCAVTLPYGTLVTLTATPDAASTFAGWTGACSGTGPCQVTVDQARSVGATFTRRQVTLTLSLAGPGAGSVATGAQGACALGLGQPSTSCRLTIDVGTVVTLTATPAVGSTFAGWSGSCSGGATAGCSITLQNDATIAAAFALAPVQVTVQAAGGANGLGSIVSSPAGIACSLNGVAATGACGNAFAVGSRVTLTASPASNARFIGWGGACAGSTGPSCSFTITAPAVPTPTPPPTSVTARFDVLLTALQASGGGTGGGAITSAPAGLDCRVDAGTAAAGAVCLATFPQGSSVTLTAMPDAASTFAGWSGACTGSGATCTLTQGSGQTAVATFTKNPYVLAVATAGTGAGSVSASPTGVACPGTCSAPYPAGTVVTLTATPNASSTFGGWSGGVCSGTSTTCTVTMSAARSVTAAFSAVVPTYTLSASTAGSGTGSVTSSPAGIGCPGACATSFTAGTVVTLAAAPSGGSTFTGWSGACSGTGPCAVTMDAAKSVTATFAAPTFALSVSRAGTGNGVVTSSPGGIDCPGTCATSYPAGTVVTLTASPNATSAFGGWSGACSGTGACTVTLDAAKSVTATFSAVVQSQALGVVLAGSGTGGVTSSPGGINCPTTCGSSYPAGTTVALTATPTGGSTFTGWSGACVGAGSCVVAMDAAKSVTATFTAPLPTFALSVSTAGGGSGAVTSSPAGINCPGGCATTLTAGTVVTLSAVPSSGSAFGGWAGACSGTGACTVTMDAAKSVTASFSVVVPTYALGVVLGGSGTGGVTSSPGGISCPTTCSTSYPAGTVVTLTAAAIGGSTFGGWSGACAGTAPCTVAMDAAKNVVATFTVVPSFALSVATSGSGVGTVTSSVGAVSCPGTCTASYLSGTVVTLTAAASSGSTFGGWSGACSGTGPCAVTMDAAKTVTASFSVVVVTHALTVATGGTGTGAVTSSPAGINCPTTCATSYPAGTVVTLSAVPSGGSAFGGWGGACSGTGACVVTLDAAKSVTATFAPPTFALSVSRAGTGNGVVTSSPGGIDCPGACVATYSAGTAVTLTAAAGASSAFGGWSGACSGTSTTCTVTMAAAQSVTATFSAVVQSQALGVVLAGSGTGGVTSSPGGISCPTTCGSSYPAGTTVALTATPTGGSTFTGWSGACIGAGSCVVAMDAAKSVTATFTAPLPTFALSVSTAGSGTGRVTSSPAGIDCPGACATTLTAGTVVTLTAAPGSSSTFSGWSGACSGTGACSVTMDAVKSVTASFSIVVPTYALGVTLGGTGAGAVTSSPGGINCPSACGSSYVAGTVVTLTATATSGSTFGGWGGACSGTGACAVTMDAAKSVTASFSVVVPTYALGVAVTGSGGGLVTSTPSGISCPTTCATSYTAGTPVTLSAAPNATSTFIGWSGGPCTGAAPCTLTMDAAKNVTATFSVQTFALGVATAGAGTGAVTSSPAGIDCPTACAAGYAAGTAVTLTATPTGGSTFSGWSGACAGTGACLVTMSTARNVTATFAAPTFALTAATAGAGTGSVTSNPAGIGCPGACATSFTAGTVVTLAAAPSGGSTFTGWSGACSGTGPCAVTMDAAKSVTATFAAPTFALSVSRAGTGNGVVTSSPGGIDCPGACATSYPAGTVVTLTASPNATSAFGGWSGACSGTGACTVTMDAAKSVTASFSVVVVTHALTVATAGTGAGSVTSSPAGINCPTTCATSYSAGTVVTLTPTPTGGSTFAGWSGACTGSGSCSVTMGAAQSVTATFTAPVIPTYTLTVSTGGSGGGTVTSSPAGISCPTTCATGYAASTVVALTAAPNGGSTFTGWSGACSGTGPCNVTMDAAKSVTATFAQQTFALSVSTGGSGTGAVSSSPAGITCPTTCSASYPVGTAVTLTAVAGSGSTFTAWGGACSTSTGTTCTVTMSAARSVTATFATVPTYALTVTTSGTGSGSVASSPTGIACPGTCTAGYTGGTVVTLTATAAAGSVFTSWSGACTGKSSTCTVTMSAAHSVTAQFGPAPTQTLTVTFATGPGTGVVTSSPAGINCSTGPCSASFPVGTVVTLTATPDVGSRAIWQGGTCTGTGPCTITVTMSQARTATVQFRK